MRLCMYSIHPVTINMTQTYKPAPRYLGKKVKEKLRVQLGNDKLMAEAPSIVSNAIAKGWIKKSSHRPMTDAEINTFRFQNPHDKTP